MFRKIETGEKIIGLIYEFNQKTGVLMLLSENELKELGFKVLKNSNVAEDVANMVSEALVLAELDGVSSHGFSRIPYYADQALCKKVDGHIKPVLKELSPSALYVDAKHGFAFPAINLGLEKAVEMVKKTGIVMLGIGHSHHCGVAGQYVERLARQNLVSLMFANTPSAMAPFNGSISTFGTNPLAFGCPRKNDNPILVDMALSKVARGKILAAKHQGKSIPDDWAIDADGNPTTDPEKALGGSMLAIAGAKGSALALMVEILAVAITSSSFAYEASSFFDTKGGPPNIGQFFVIIDPFIMNNGFFERIDDLVGFMLAQDGVQLPGDRRYKLREKLKKEGINIPDVLYEELIIRAK